MTLESLFNPDLTEFKVNVVRPESVTRKEMLEVWDEVVVNDIYQTADIVSPDDVWLDVGSHLGFFSIAAMMSGAKWCMLVDEDQERLDHGVWNARRYDCLRKAEMGEVFRAGRSEVLTPPVHTHILDGEAGRLQKRVERVADLPRYVGEGDKWSGGKFDIQGSEKELFKQSKELSSMFQQIVFEWHYPISELHLEGFEITNQKKHSDVLLNTDTWIVWANAL